MPPSISLDILFTEGGNGIGILFLFERWYGILNEPIANTFVTPVFIGSASLRDAAGQLIEDTVRTIRRKEDFNEETVTKMFENMTTMYHLDEIRVDGEWKKDFGPLPQTALILLYAMVTVWIVLGVIFVTRMIRRKEKRGA